MSEAPAEALAPGLPPEPPPRPRPSRLVGALLAWVGRTLAVALASVPAWLAARAHLADGPARSPWFVDAGRPLPAVQLVVLAEDLLEATAPLLALAALLGWLGQLAVTAGAAAALDPRAAGPVAPRFLRALVAWLGPFLRVALVSGALLAAGGALVSLGGDALEAAARRGRWSGDARGIVVPAVQLAVAVLWAAFVAALALHVRVALVLSGRRRVRAALGTTLRAWRARPLALPALAAAFFALSPLAGGAALVAWRQTGGALPWVAAAFAGLAVQAALWVLLVHLACTSLGPPAGPPAPAPLRETT